MFCRWFFGDPGLVLEANCSKTPEPDLRGYRHMRHKGILFDEATPRMVLDLKKLLRRARICWRLYRLRLPSGWKRDACAVANQKMP
jgi:hypothetical protein